MKLLFKILLLLQAIALLLYSYYAYRTDGPNLFNTFFTQITALNWSGQFNLDFMCYLMLSGIWIMWRDQFSLKSIAIGLLAMVLGIVFFAPYLLYLSISTNSDIKKMLMGKAE